MYRTDELIVAERFLKGKLVYVNYGRVEDFENVTEIVNITGCICVARYGKIFRGNKAALAEKFGCSGLILYSDPADFASTGTNEVYPNSWWLPGTGVQRGSLSLTIGDPLTPLYPATESAYRLDPSEAQLPRIPVQPIGYDDARVLLQNMTGPESPPDWKGRLDVPYNIGPGYGNDDLHVRMDVSTTSKLATTYNVIGFIEGRVEPDRYVILGNHHDAWVFGAVDPSSGTAVMLELSRAFGKLLARGWRPRRTIVFCAWGAEEQGLIGSREWVENFGHILGHRAVAYINVDVAVQGNFTLRGNALPLLKDVLYDVAKSTLNPDEEEIRAGRRNVYETWLKRSPEKNATGQLTGRPRVGLLGSGSDYDPFITAIGVTSIDLRYSFDESLGLSSYPLYHSAYETAHLFETYIDPSFKFSTALGQIWAELARRLADSILIPFNVSTYAQTIDSQVRSLEQRYGSLLRRNRIDLEPLHQAVQNFTQASADFEDLVSRTSKEDTQAVRRLNDQMMQLERAFIDPPGVLDRRGQRHVLFAPSMNNLYSGSGLPGLVDSLFRIEKVKNDGERRRRWNEVAKQVSILTFFVETAAASLSRPTEFLSDRGIIQQPSGEVFD